MEDTFNLDQFDFEGIVVDLRVEAEWYDGEKRTYWHPGSDGELYINRVERLVDVKWQQIKPGKRLNERLEEAVGDLIDARVNEHLYDRAGSIREARAEARALLAE